MNNIEIAATQMLCAAAELYNDAEILREALEDDDREAFSFDYIESEGRTVVKGLNKLREKMSDLMVLCVDGVLAASAERED